MTFVVRLTEESVAMLEEIRDRRVRGKLFDRIRKLAVDPEHQGKALVDELAGCRSVRALGQRYRIVYRVDRKLVEVLVVGVGLRRAGDRTDVYRRTTRQASGKGRPNGRGDPRLRRARSAALIVVDRRQ